MRADAKYIPMVCTMRLQFEDSLYETSFPFVMATTDFGRGDFILSLVIGFEKRKPLVGQGVP